MAEKIGKCGIQSFLREAHSSLSAGQMRPETGEASGFQRWLKRCPFTTASLQTWSSGAIANLIDWASQARWHYREQLQGLPGLHDMEKPPWLDGLHKMARYHSAIKSMVKLAAKQPEVFTDIRIREIEAHSPRPFSLSKEEAYLRAAIKNLVPEDPTVIMERLEEHLCTQDVETKLHRACKVNLTLHAEMQMIVFYEGNPRLAPRMRFMGTSKKACFLCHEYLRHHPLGLQVSACHQKIYPTWMPPPYYPIPRRYKSPVFNRVSKTVEQVTRAELKTRLIVTPRPKNQDSTAGPSLTRTATVPTGLEPLQ